MNEGQIQMYITLYIVQLCLEPSHLWRHCNHWRQSALLMHNATQVRLWVIFNDHGGVRACVFVAVIICITIRSVCKCVPEMVSQRKEQASPIMRVHLQLVCIYVRRIVPVFM